VDTRLYFSTTLLTHADRRLVRVYADGGIVAIPVDAGMFGHYALGEAGPLPGTVLGKLIGVTTRLEEEVTVP